MIAAASGSVRSLHGLFTAGISTIEVLSQPRISLKLSHCSMPDGHFSRDMSAVVAKECGCFMLTIGSFMV